MKNTTNGTSSEEISVFFDAMRFWVEERNFTVSEDALIDMFGNPEETEEWKHIVSDTRYYPIKTLYYEENENSMSGYTYSYHFNDGMLQRIIIDGVQIEYSNVKDILKMFNLKEYSNSEITNTGVAYRITNCDVRSLWIQSMDEEYLKTIAIDYGKVF